MRFAHIVLLGSSLSVVSCGVGTTSATDSAPSAATVDFNKRCSRPGVIRCVGFDKSDDIMGRQGRPSGIMMGASEPTLDTGIKASGASSLKFTIPSNSGANTSGSYFTNFSDDFSIQFGENQEFFVQWRQRFSREFISTKYKGGGGWKSIIVGTGDQPKKPYYSCTALEVVMTNYYGRGFPVLYNSCTGSTSHGAYDLFQEVMPPYDFKFQNKRPAPYCLYSQGRLYAQGLSSYFPPNGNCFGYFPDEWMTFQLKIKTGLRVKDEFVNSYVSLWMARENQPSELVIEWGPYNLTAGNPADNQRFGKVWLLPYNTGKDPSDVHPVGYTWYDELIISHFRIDDPGHLRKAAR